RAFGGGDWFDVGVVDHLRLDGFDDFGGHHARRVGEGAVAVGAGDRLAVVDRREGGEVGDFVGENAVELADVPGAPASSPTAAVGAALGVGLAAERAGGGNDDGDHQGASDVHGGDA